MQTEERSWPTEVAYECLALARFGRRHHGHWSWRVSVRDEPFVFQRKACSLFYNPRRLLLTISCPKLTLLEEARMSEQGICGLDSEVLLLMGKWFCGRTDDFEYTVEFQRSMDT